MNPYELLYMLRMDDRRAQELIYREYIGMVRSVAAALTASFPVAKPYREDIIQEGSLMILAAADRYREDRDAGFSTFLNVLIHRRISNAIRSISRKYPNGHNDMLELSSDLFDCGVLEEAVPQTNRMFEPEYYTEYQLAKERYDKAVEKLSAEERKILNVCVTESDKKRSAEKLHMNQRLYYNASARIRRKIITEVMK